MAKVTAGGLAGKPVNGSVVVVPSTASTRSSGYAADQTASGSIRPTLVPSALCFIGGTAACLQCC